MKEVKNILNLYIMQSISNEVLYWVLLKLLEFGLNIKFLK